MKGWPDEICTNGIYAIDSACRMRKKRKSVAKQAGDKVGQVVTEFASGVDTVSTRAWRSSSKYPNRLRQRESKQLFPKAWV